MIVIKAFFGGVLVAFVVWLLTTLGGVSFSLVTIAVPASLAIGTVASAIALRLASGE